MSDQTDLIETWVPVAGYESLYMVSDKGRVRSVDRIDTVGRLRKGRFMKAKKNSRGYLSLQLCKDATPKDCTVHSLVLSSFIGPCPDGMEGCHNDGNPSNCNLDNLRWDTHRANMMDKSVHGTSQHGEKNGSAKLSEVDVRMAFALREEGLSLQRIADFFGVSKSCVFQAISGKTWRYMESAA